MTAPLDRRLPCGRTVRDLLDALTDEQLFALWGTETYDTLHQAIGALLHERSAGFRSH